MISRTFLVVNDFLGIVKSSNMFLRHPNPLWVLWRGWKWLEGVNYAINHIRDVPKPCFNLNIVFCGTFLDVNHFRKIVKSSNLLLRHPNTSVDVVEGWEGALRNTVKLAARAQARVASVYPTRRGEVYV